MGIKVLKPSFTILLLLVSCHSLAQDRLNGKPNLNGMWQALGTAYWNLEAHPSEELPQIWPLGALGGIPAGQSYVVGGKIPYLAGGQDTQLLNKTGWPASDPMISCFMPGIPRATYMPFPFQILQSDSDLLFSYAFATSNRTINMGEVDEAPIDMWMGWSRGRWEGDTLVIEVTSNDDRTWFDRAGNHHSYMMKVTERYTPVGNDHIEYEATIEDSLTFSEPWTIRMPLYRYIDDNAELLEYKCVEFAEELLYGEFENED